MMIDDDMKQIRARFEKLETGELIFFAKPEWVRPISEAKNLATTLCLRRPALVLCPPQASYPATQSTSPLIDALGDV